MLYLKKNKILSKSNQMDVQVDKNEFVQIDRKETSIMVKTNTRKGFLAISTCFFEIRALFIFKKPFYVKVVKSYVEVVQKLQITAEKF